MLHRLAMARQARKNSREKHNRDSVEKREGLTTKGRYLALTRRLWHQTQATSCGDRVQESNGNQYKYSIRLA